MRRIPLSAARNASNAVTALMPTFCFHTGRPRSGLRTKSSAPELGVGASGRQPPASAGPSENFVGSVAFYEALGFEERRRLPIRDEAINVFMGLPGDGDRLELTYNFGVDSYELGTGYGHVAVTVDDLEGTLERLAEQGIEPERPPYRVREGGSRLCFVRDPDRKCLSVN